MMEVIMKKALYSCKRATELVDRRSLEPLSLVDNLRLNIHLKMCDACHRYQKESAFLDAQLSRGFKFTRKGLSNEEKEPIIKHIHDH